MRFGQFIVAFWMCGALHQVPIASPKQSRSLADNTGKLNPQLHSDVLKLIELDGTRQRMQGGMKQAIEDGKAQMMKQSPLCNSTFADEWERRMLTRIKVEDFVNAVVAAFERHFTDDEVKQLIALVTSKDSSQLTTMSVALKQKLASIMPAVQSEILGGCVQIGAN